MYIARVPPAEQADVVAAHSEYHKARLAHATAENDWKEWKTQIEISRNELKAASLMESSAQTRKKAADASGDMNRVNTATREIRSAEMARKAADMKVDYYKAKHKFLKKYAAYKKEEMYYKQAQHELAKADVAKQKNIRPKGFAYPAYQKQVQGRSRDVQRAKFQTDRERTKIDGLKAKWQKQQAAAEKLRPGSAGGTNTGSTGSSESTGSTGTVTTEPTPDGDKKNDAPDNSDDKSKGGS